MTPPDTVWSVKRQGRGIGFIFISSHRGVTFEPLGGRVNPAELKEIVEFLESLEERA